MLYFWDVQVLTIRSCSRHGFRDTIMIKNILTTMALLSLSLCTKAQDLPLVLSGHNEVGILPGSFTISGDDQLYTYPISERVGADGYDGISHFNLYDHRLNPIRSITAESGVIPFSYNRSGDKCFLHTTQNLFNFDDKYEYISALSFDETYHQVTGIKIQNEDGEILAEIPFGDKWKLPEFSNRDSRTPPIRIYCLFSDRELKGYFYLCFDLWRENSNYDTSEECITRIYSFEEGKISTSIKKVRDISTRMKVNPVMPRRNEIVSVDISSVQSPTSLTVVSAAGQVVCSQNLHDEQKNASIDTSRLTSGLYIVRVANSNKEYENCRIIIR